jgi:CheY-like chemotaxis protein
MFRKLKNLKTLLIDDDEFVRDSLRLMFESRHCFLCTVHTAEEAIEALRRQDYDIIITDYKLPGMDGLQLCRYIQKSHPHAMKILITAYGSRAVEEEANSVGIHELIEKPITSEAIEASLSRLFDEQSGR